MSAIATYCWAEHGITVASDGITYGSDGVIGGFVSKVLPVPEMNCIIANVGAGGVAAHLRDKLTLQCSSFDDVLDHLVSELAAVMALREVFAPDDKTNATVLAGGWSDREQRFSLYKIHSQPRYYFTDDGEKQFTAPAGTLIPISEGLWCSHSPSEMATERAGLNIVGEVKADEILGRHVCAARMDSSMSGEGEHAGVPYFVGGFLQITNVRRDVTTIRIAHRWPDKVGVPFDPAAGQAMPDRWYDD